MVTVLFLIGLIFRLVFGFIGLAILIAGCVWAYTGSKNATGHVEVSVRGVAAFILKDFGPGIAVAAFGVGVICFAIDSSTFVSEQDGKLAVETSQLSMSPATGGELDEATAEIYLKVLVGDDLLEKEKIVVLQDIARRESRNGSSIYGTTVPFLTGGN